MAREMYVSRSEEEAEKSEEEKAKEEEEYYSTEKEYSIFYTRYHCENLFVRVVHFGDDAFFAPYSL